MKLQNNLSNYAFIGVVAVLVYLFFVIAKTYFTYMLMGGVIALAFYPVYAKILSVIKNDKAASSISVVLIILIIVIPTILTGYYVTLGTLDLVSSVDRSSIEKVEVYLDRTFGFDAGLTERVPAMLIELQTYFLSSGIRLAGSLADVMAGLLIMFSVIYFGLAESSTWTKNAKKFLPVEKDRKEKLIWDIKSVTNSVLYGQVLVSVLMGVLGGLSFWIAGVENAVFWGFIMAVFALLPVVGTGLVWIPAGIIKILEGNLAAGIFLLAFGFIVLGGISYFVPPLIVSSQSKIHPLIILIGIFGGLKVFGFAGFLIGPIVAALFFTVIEFYYEDYLDKKSNSQ